MRRLTFKTTRMFAIACFIAVISAGCKTNQCRNTQPVNQFPPVPYSYSDNRQNDKATWNNWNREITIKEGFNQGSRDQGHSNLTKNPALNGNACPNDQPLTGTPIGPQPSGPVVPVPVPTLPAPKSGN